VTVEPHLHTPQVFGEPQRVDVSGPSARVPKYILVSYCTYPGCDKMILPTQRLRRKVNHAQHE
jgi:hypothetical protein